MAQEADTDGGIALNRSSPTSFVHPTWMILVGMNLEDVFTAPC